MGLQYLSYNGDDTIVQCDKCRKYIKKRGKKKYCKKCAKEMQLEKYKKYNKKRKHNHQ